VGDKEIFFTALAKDGSIEINYTLLFRRYIGWKVSVCVM